MHHAVLFLQCMRQLPHSAECLLQVRLPVCLQVLARIWCLAPASVRVWASRLIMHVGHRLAGRGVITFTHM